MEYHSLPRNKDKSATNTGWISEIWKKIQVNIYHIHTASTETNDTSKESPDIQLYNDTLKVIVSLKLTSREVIEGKKSKTLHTHKIQQNMLFAASRRGALLIMPRPLLGCKTKGLSAEVSFVSVLAMVSSEY